MDSNFVSIIDTLNSRERIAGLFFFNFVKGKFDSMEKISLFPKTAFSKFRVWDCKQDHIPE